MIPLTTQRLTVQRLITRDPCTVTRYRQDVVDVTYTGTLAPTGLGGGTYYSSSKPANFPPISYGWVLILAYDSAEMLKGDTLYITRAGHTSKYNVLLPRYMGDKWVIEMESLD